MVNIASRSSWGARYQDGVGTRAVGNLNRYLHHSVTKHLSANASVAEERAQVRVIEAIGQQRFGRGISYTYIVFPSGRIYQGASTSRISYHSGGWRNTSGVGICLAGNYEANPMTDTVVNAVAALLRQGVKNGWWKSATITEGHRQFKSTACPGKNAFNRIADINRAASKGGAGGSSKPSKPSSKPKAPEKGAMPNTWAVQVRLHRMGYRKAAPTGSSKGSHKVTVKRYQRAQLHPAGGLKGTGVWDETTEAHYDWVRLIQETMNKWKGVDLVVDGDYGPKTRAAVRTLQSRNKTGAYRKAGGRIVDGIPGPVTCRMLGITTHP